MMKQIFWENIISELGKIGTSETDFVMIQRYRRVTVSLTVFYC